METRGNTQLQFFEEMQDVAQERINTPIKAQLWGDDSVARGLAEPRAKEMTLGRAKAEIAKTNRTREWKA